MLRSQSPELHHGQKQIRTSRWQPRSSLSRNVRHCLIRYSRWLLVSGVYAVSDQRAPWITALTLAIPAVALNTVHAFWPEQTAVPVLIVTILFLVLALASLLRAVVCVQARSFSILEAVSGTIFSSLVSLASTLQGSLKRIRRPLASIPIQKRTEEKTI